MQIDASSHTRWPVSLLILLFGIAVAAAIPVSPAVAQEPEDPEPAQENRLILEFPFEIISGKPFVQVRVNDSEPLWFILDTGCAGPCTIVRERAIKLGLELVGEKTVHTGAGEGVEIRVASTPGVTIDIHGEKLPTGYAGVAELRHVASYEGHPVDGLLGRNFMERYAVEIDYAKKIIRLFDPESYTYAGPGRSIPIDFLSGLVLTRTTITPPGREPIECRTIVDTGARVTFIFNRPFVERHRLRESQTKMISGTIGGGAGGECKGDIGRLASARWGPYLIQAPVAIFSRDRSGVLSSDGFDAILGGDLLRRCRVTFDYRHRQMILEPYKDKPTPYEYDMSGLFLVAEGEDFKTFKVQSVSEDTPAHDAGMQKGDVITAINGRPASEYTLDELRQLFRVDGTECRLDLQRGEEDLEVNLHLKKLI